MLKSAVFELLKPRPGQFGIYYIYHRPAGIFLSLLGLVAIGLVVNFKSVTIIINVIMSSFFLVAIIFKLFLALVGSRFELHQAVTREELKRVVDDDLPVYTILLPVYKEDNLIKKLIWNLQALIIRAKSWT